MNRKKHGKTPAATERARPDIPVAESRPGSGRSAASEQGPGSRAGASSSRESGGKFPGHR